MPYNPFMNGLKEVYTNILGLVKIANSKKNILKAKLFGHRAYHIPQSPILEQHTERNYAKKGKSETNGRNAKGNNIKIKVTIMEYG